MTDKDTALPETTDEGRIVLLKNIMSASVEGYATRLDDWKRATGIDHPECAHEICGRPATHGAMAIRAFSADRKRYIYPACETCVRRTEMLYVKGPLVVINDK